MEVPLFLQPGPSTLGENINVAQFRDDNDDNGDNRNNDDDISAAEDCDVKPQVGDPLPDLLDGPAGAQPVRRHHHLRRRPHNRPGEHPSSTVLKT